MLMFNGGVKMKNATKVINLNTSHVNVQRVVSECKELGIETFKYISC